ncbi:MAG: hypothetical protein HC819_20465 [Cyclobacteriaceae bacterium]|nr:hypothetical protein [Cyclobacteriaceae bacterium]
MSRTKIKQISVRTLILAFGVGLGVFIFSASFSGEAAQLQAGFDQLMPAIHAGLTSQGTLAIERPIEGRNRQAHQLHHNFIVSILFQESSYERKIVAEEDQGDFLSHVKLLHRSMVSHGLVFF